jgi:hypothetical protein
MRIVRALAAGTFGAVAAVAIMTLAERLFGVRADPSSVLGAVVTGRPSWGVGVALQLVAGALAGVVYGAVFELVTRRAAWWLGALVGVAHAAVAGLALGAVSVRLPSDLADLAPGAFVAYHGLVAAITFVAAHVVYGAIVGAMYGPVRHPPMGDTVVRWREAYPAARHSSTHAP